MLVLTAFGVVPPVCAAEVEGARGRRVAEGMAEPNDRARQAALKADGDATVRPVSMDQPSGTGWRGLFSNVMQNVPAPTATMAGIALLAVLGFRRIARRQ